VHESLPGISGDKALSEPGDLQGISKQNDPVQKYEVVGDTPKGTGTITENLSKSTSFEAGGALFILEAIRNMSEKERAAVVAELLKRL